MLNDVAAFPQLRLRYHQRGSEADDVLLGGLGQQPVVTQLHAHIVGGDPMRFVDDQRVQEALATDLDQKRHREHEREPSGSQKKWRERRV